MASGSHLVFKPAVPGQLPGILGNAFMFDTDMYKAILRAFRAHCLDPLEYSAGSLEAREQTLLTYI